MTRGPSRRCHRIDDLPFSIELWKAGPDDFTILYGLDIKKGLTYVAAATELGRCIMHALACESKIDNRTMEELNLDTE